MEELLKKLPNLKDFINLLSEDLSLPVGLMNFSEEDDYLFLITVEKKPTRIMLINDVVKDIENPPHEEAIEELRDMILEQLKDELEIE